MAYRTNQPTLIKNPQLRSTPSTKYLSQPYEFSTLPFGVHPDHDEIMGHLQTLLRNGIDVERLLPLLLEPNRSACLYLLHRLDHGLEPAYIVEHAPLPSTTKPDSSNHLSSQTPVRTSILSIQSGGSRLSGTTLGDVDISTPSKQYETWPASSTSELTPLPASPAVVSSQNSSQRPSEVSSYPHYHSLHDNDSTPNGVLSHMDTPGTQSSDSYRRRMEAKQTQHDPFSGGTFLDTASPYEDEPTPTSSFLTPQSSSAGYSQTADATPRPSHTKLPLRPSIPTATGPHAIVGYQHWSKPKSKEPGYRSPCPYCPDTFESLSNFISHVKAAHEQPILFICKHPTLKLRDCYSTTRESELKKHHTKHHGEDCSMTELCCEKSHKPHFKLIWGCWFCVHIFNSVDAWAEHHMRDHHGCLRKDMRFATLIKSLLSQDGVRFWWKRKIHSFNISKGNTHEFRWSREDPTVKQLVEALETGFYHNDAFSQKEQVLQILVDELFIKAETKPHQPNSQINKRSATSPPPPAKPISTQIPRAIQHRSSRLLSPKTSIPGFSEAYRSGFEKVTMENMRSVRKPNSDF